jgi:hypothetical protein
MALMFLGNVPHPETGEAMQVIDSAKMLIDQLEMLQAKTKGNLHQHEDALLKQSLTSLSMMFVEAVENPAAHRPLSALPEEPAAPPSQAPVDSPSPSTPSSPASSPAPEEERHKKFSKRY